MRLGKHELTEWSRSYGGWYTYNINYRIEPIISISLYHNMIDPIILDDSILDGIPESSLYRPHKTPIWSVNFIHEASDLSSIYNKLYEKTNQTEDEIKKQVENFLLRINKLIIYA